MTDASDIGRMMSTFRCQRCDMPADICKGCVEKVETEVANLKLQLSEKQKQYDIACNRIEAMERGRDVVNAQLEEYQKTLKKIDAMRKRLPDPDFAEQKNTAAGIAEIIEVALKEKRKCEHKHCHSGKDGCTGGQGSCSCKCDDCTVIRNVYC